MRCADPPRRSLSPGDLGLWSDENQAALAPIVDFCRGHGGARIGIQLQHAGRKGSVTVAWEGQREIPIDRGGWPLHGADAIPYPNRMMPVALDLTMIRELIADYAAAARRADRIGIDLIEIHAAHGYLLHNFLSPLSNQRRDAYGGDREGRMRFVLEVFQAIRDAWPSHKPIGVRLSATDWTNGGWTIEDSVVFARRLKALGCDYVTASSGGTVPRAEDRGRAGLSGAVRGTHSQGGGHPDHGRRADYATGPGGRNSGVGEG